MHFDSHAEAYDRARPPYPEALWSGLREFGVPRSGVRVIELGAGTGQATERLLSAGAKVTAIEPGRILATLLRGRCPDARVVVASAEEAVLAEAQYDLAVAATSMHWLDLDVVLPKLHLALAPGGLLAVWRTSFGDPHQELTPFRHRVNAIVAQRTGEAIRPGPGEHDTEEWAQRLSSSGDFSVIHVAEHRWSIDLDADQVGDLFSTFSNWTPSEVSAAVDALRQLGGRVTEHYVTPLILLERAGWMDDGAGGAGRHC